MGPSMMLVKSRNEILLLTAKSTVQENKRQRGSSFNFDSVNSAPVKDPIDLFLPCTPHNQL